MSNLIWKKFCLFPLLIISTCLLLGITLGSVLATSFLPVLIIFSCFLAIFGLVTSLLSRQPISIILILIFLFGAGEVVLRDYLSSKSLLLENDIVDEKAIVVSIPRIVNNHQIFLLDIQRSVGREKVYAQANIDDNLKLGDQLIVSGTVIDQKPNNSLGHWRGYLKSKGVSREILIDNMANNLDPYALSRKWQILIKIDRFRANLLASIKKNFAFPENSLVAGIVLGEKDSLTNQSRSIFEKTGTSHILVASGANVMILGWIINGLLGALDKRLARIVTILTLLIFIIVSGADASIIRASLFYLLLMLAQILGRPVHLPTILIFIAALMAIVNPWIVLYDISFQLSFAAIVGLSVFSNWLSTLIKIWPINEWLAPTLAAQLTTLPIITYYFGKISLIAPLVNFLIAPLVPIIMIGGLISLITPWLMVIIWSVEGVSRILLSIVQYFGDWNWAILNLPSHHWGYMIISATPIIIAVIMKSRFKIDERD